MSSFEFLGHSDQIRDRPDLTRYDYSEPSFVVTPVIRINDISNSTHGVMLLRLQWGEGMKTDHEAAVFWALSVWDLLAAKSFFT